MSRLDAWSRRKAQVAEAEAAEARTARREAVEAAMAEKTDADICAELDLPDPAQLGPGDDFTAFLKSEVPERLRRVALRKLWLSNPALANVDGLVDYGEDFTMGTGAGEVLATAYKVGKGFVEKLAEPEGSADEPAQDLPAPEVTVPDMPLPEAIATDSADLPQEVAAIAAPMAESAPVPDLPVRRRMRFEFRDQERCPE